MELSVQATLMNVLAGRKIKECIEKKNGNIRIQYQISSDILPTLKVISGSFVC